MLLHKMASMLVGVALVLNAYTGTQESATTQTTEPTRPAIEDTWQAGKDRCLDVGQHGSCPLDGYDDRPYDGYLPPSYDPATPIPVVIGIHGGGGKSASAAETSCPGGDLNNPACLHSIGMREGYLTLYPNGTGSRLLKNVRTWSAGGGGDWNCASGTACQDGIDDIAYFNALLDDLESWLHVDTTRVFATGLSNGGAMSHRLGCELSSRITAIAPVGGANPFSTAAECSPEQPVPVLQIHGTADPCWTYHESAEACIGGDGKRKMGVELSTEEWATRNDCALEPTETRLPDAIDDDTTTTRIS